MMLYPSMSEMLKQVPSRYMLVNVVAQRARQISATAESFHEPLQEKPVSMAIQDVAEGKVSISELDPDLAPEPDPE
ncbi:MAG: DNA-directed RNA polymerase subunit omega [Oscillospiraceae bacterium]|nr:DNA-directed RNA polymerase subunit omega [Oscillospiraceae bacterium]MCD8376538.1 DNA-directed RNA polymerase subunit omega [Oscillospiraceae bacterium]